ncbi:response regulator [Larkinella soli]|uniref:response regulator n=1 Tax=Larkinella soli TaxID=1770527 RepID=UPI000FFB1606|nr:response regulator [Larkinella soli]
MVKRYGLYIADREEADALRLKNYIDQNWSDTDVRIFTNGADLWGNLLDDNPLPSVIIMGQNLPPEGGLPTLRKLKEHNFFRLVPVILFSTQEDRQRVTEAYQDGANAYMVKPDSVGKVGDIMENIRYFWFK